MKWTFGIITTEGEEERVKKVISSIVSQGMPCEVIVVGGSSESIGGPVHNDITLRYIAFDESIKDKWITRKKNIITERASYDNICYMHDYVSLRPGWFQGFEKFGDNWLTCMTRITNMDGRRFRDWCVIHNNSWMNPPIDDEEPPAGPGRLLDYNDNTSGRWQYYSGAYFCAKKEVMEEIPLDEERVWGGGEDVQHSRLLYQRYGQKVFNMNVESEVRFLKNKQRAPWE